LKGWATLLGRGNNDEAPLEKSWVMPHLDVETTGLVAGHHEVVDLGIVYTTANGEVLDRWYRRIQPHHPERTSPEAAKINGFEVVRVAYNSKFDAAFMDHLLREHGAA
jgi:DNA polymerase III epsilon subunit-like protein